MHQGVFRLKELSSGGPSCPPLYVLCLLQGGELLLSGAGDCLKLWNTSSRTITQTFWLGGDVLASRQANLGDHGAGVFIGASDGSVSLFEVKKGMLSLVLKWYVSGLVDYMYLDYASGKLAVICGAAVCLWTILTPIRGCRMQFSISQIPIPAGSLTPLNKSGSVMQARTIHFLCEIQSILLSFVAEDITKLACHLAIFHLPSWRCVKAVDVNRRIGFSTLSDDRQTFAFTNLVDGVDVYSATTLEYQCSIKHVLNHENNIAIGLVILSNEYIISGGSYGLIHIDHTNKGQVVGRLNTPTSRSTIQAVAACSRQGRSLIVGGSVDGKVVIWDWETMEPHSDAQAITPTYTRLNITAALVLGLCAVYTLYFQLRRD